MTIWEKLQKAIDETNHGLYRTIMTDKQSLDFLSFAVDVWANGGTIRKAGDPLGRFTCQPHGDAEPEDSKEWKRFMTPIMAQLECNARKIFFASITREQAQMICRVLDNSEKRFSVSLHAAGLEMDGSDICSGWWAYHNGENLFPKEAQSDSDAVPAGLEGDGVYIQTEDRYVQLLHR